MPAGGADPFFDENLGCVIDNGSHMMLGANEATRSYLADAGSEDAVTEIAPAAFPFVDVPSGERWRVAPGPGPHTLLAAGPRPARRGNRTLRLFRDRAPRLRRTGRYRERPRERRGEALRAVLAAALPRGAQHRRKRGFGPPPVAHDRGYLPARREGLPSVLLREGALGRAGGSRIEDARRHGRRDPLPYAAPDDRLR